MKNIRFGLTSLLLGVALMGFSQQKALYTQYMFNGLTINPAYAGTQEALSLTGMSRWQWVGFEGAPNTQTVSIHSPINGKNVGLGFMVSRDEIGVTSTTDISAMYSYQLKMGSGYLSMGLQGNITNYDGRYTNALVASNDPDNSFAANVSEFAPNFGAGLFYYTSKFYLGVSSPELLNNKIESGTGTMTTQRHIFANAGLVFNVSNSVKLKPNVLMKMVGGAPVSYDFNLNALFAEIFWVGVSVRPPESISGIVQINVSQRFSVGYAYDQIINDQLKEASVSSHEVMLNYRIPLFKDRVITPRYF